MSTAPVTAPDNSLNSTHTPPLPHSFPISSSSTHTISQGDSVPSNSQSQSMTSSVPSVVHTTVITTKRPIATMPDKPESTVSTSKTPIKVATTSSSIPSSTSSHTTSSATSTSHKTSTSHSSVSTPATKPTPLQTLSQIPSDHSLTSTTSKEIETPASSDEVKTRSTKTSTITDHPESTLSSAIVIPITSNGKVSLSTPAIVTISSTSTQADGDFITYTHVVANPTDHSTGSNVLNTSGFLDNRGAVAGVFIVVGVVVATIAVCFTLLFRRYRRLNRRKRWLAGMHQQEHSAPFDPFEDPPQMRAFENETERTATNRYPADSHIMRPSSVHSSSQQHSLAGLMSLDPTMPATNHQVFLDGLWSDLPSHNINHIVNTNSRGSIAQSSPSIYPPSLPPTGDDDNLAATQWPAEEAASQPPHNPFIVEAPPRPPRSLLRQNSVKTSEVFPLTPPASISSHSQSKPPSPTTPDQPHKGPQDILNRRTLLDVRPRSSRDSGFGTTDLRMVL